MEKINKMLMKGTFSFVLLYSAFKIKWIEISIWGEIICSVFLFQFLFFQYYVTDLVENNLICNPSILLVKLSWSITNEYSQLKKNIV